MKTLLAVAVAALALTPAAFAQPRAGVFEVDSVEAVVTVVKVDPAARTVTVRGARGDLITVSYVQALAFRMLPADKPAARK